LELFQEPCPLAQAQLTICLVLCFRQLRCNLLAYLHVTSLFFIPEEQVKALSSQWSD